MSYRNRTYVAYASEDIRQYRLMRAWREVRGIEFDFIDAHDLFLARDTGRPEWTRSSLRERLKNATQVVLLGSADAQRKGSDGSSFLSHEVEVAMAFDLPVVVANLDGHRRVDRAFIPAPLLVTDYHTVSVSFQPTMIQFALDHYAADFAACLDTGARYYDSDIYQGLGL